MRSYCILLLLILIINPIFAQKKTKIIKTYPDGQIKEKGIISLPDSTRIGKWYFYFHNGQLSMEGEYDSNGLEIGTWKQYYPNGEIYIVEAKDNGPIKAYYKYPDTLKMTGQLKNRKPEGEWIIYYENGNIQSRQYFSEGKMIGQWEYYFENGKLWKIISSDTGPVIIYDSLGNKIEEWHIVNGQMDGEHKTYTTHGTLISKITYKNGKKDGPYELYHGNGQKALEGFYKDDKKIGIWKYYYPNKKLAKEENQATGPCYSWY